MKLTIPTKSNENNNVTNETNDRIRAAEENDLGKDEIKIEEREQSEKIRSVTNKWNLLYDQILVQVWIDQK